MNQATMASNSTASNTTSGVTNASQNNLLNPNSALDQQQHHTRRRSTLSGNGFFIDYSCTRRRSSAVRDQQQQQQQHPVLAGLMDRKQQFLRAHASPVRLSRNSFCVGQQQQHKPSQQYSQPVSPARTGSRASYSVGPTNSSSHSMHLLLPVHASPANALAGSRKTSIFDPSGHSVASQLMVARRKSAMIAGGPAGSSPGQAMLEPAANTTMLSVAKSAARARGSKGTKTELVQHVPVIGCSPTSIKASLAALDETRRYERLLRKLQRHKQRKERHRKLREKRLASGLDADDDAGRGELGWGLEQSRDPTEDGEWPPSSRPSGGSFRRKSLRALREAAHLFRRGAGRSGGNQQHLDTFSVSSMSFASSRSSLPSLDRYELNNDDLYPDAVVGNNMPPEARRCRLNHQGGSGDSFSDDDQTNRGATNFSHSPASTGNQTGSKSPAKKSVIKSAMRRLAASLSGTSGADRKNHPPVHRDSTASAYSTAAAAHPLRSVSVAGGMDYWYYYYYLRENSIDAIDDLPIGGSGGQATEAELRSQMHINYSLARLEILNSSTDPVARLAEKLSQAVNMANEAAAMGVGGGASPSDHYAPIFNLLDFSQSTDVSLTLSSSSSSGSGSGVSCGGSGSGSNGNISSAGSCQSSPTRGGSSSAHSPSSSSSPASAVSMSAASRTNSSLSKAMVPMANQQQSMPSMAPRNSGSSTRSGRSPLASGRASEASADDECTSLDVDSNRLRLSPSISRENSRYNAAAAGGCGTARTRLDQKRKSMSRESITQQQLQQQLERPAEVSSGGGGGCGTIQRFEEARQQQQQQQQQTTIYSSGNGGPNMRCSTANIVEMPVVSRSGCLGGNHSVRHSHNNLAVVVSDGTAAAGSPILAHSGKRSDSGSVNRGPTEARQDDNEVELDDFERMNRSHRGYKPPLDGQAAFGEHLDGMAQKHHQKHNNSGKNDTDTDFHWPQKTIRSRSSGNRLSVRSARCGRSSSSSSSRRDDDETGGRGGGGGHKRRSGSRHISMSWDTLNVDRNEIANTRNLGDPQAASFEPPLPVWATQAQAQAQTQAGHHRHEPTTCAPQGAPASPAPSSVYQAPTTSTLRSATRAQASLPASLPFAGHSGANFESCASGPTSDHRTAHSYSLNAAPNQQQQDQQQQRRSSERWAPTGDEEANSGWVPDGRGIHSHRNSSFRMKNHPKHQQQLNFTGPLVYNSTSSSTPKLAPLDNGESHVSPHYYYYCDFHLKQQQQQQQSPILRPNVTGTRHQARKSSHSPSPTSPTNSALSRDASSTINHHHQQQQQSLSQIRRATGGGGSVVNLPDVAPGGGPPGASREYSAAHQIARPGQYPMMRQHPAGMARSLSGSPDSARSDSLQVLGGGGGGWDHRESATFRSTLQASVSLKVPDWNQIGCSEQQQHPGQANGAIDGQTRCIACQREQQVWQDQLELRDTGASVAWEQAEAVQSRSIRSGDTAGSDAQVQLRARAHSTGTRGGSVRQAASQAKMDRARYLSGQSIAMVPSAASADPLEPLQHFRSQYVQSSGKEAAAPGVAGKTGLSIQTQQATPIDSGGETKKLDNSDNNEAQAREQHRKDRRAEEDLHEEHRQKKDLLNKKSFTCMLIGARQTGKRTIVKCSVKLLNEFKLAAFEYKKEKMLTKLMNCSEQLQNLVSQQEEQLEADDLDRRRLSLAPTDFPRSRINSWLGGGGGGGSGESGSGGGSGAMNRLLHLPIVGKRRLNSTVSALTAHGQDQRQNQSTLSLQQRRHTTIDHGSSQEPDGIGASATATSGDRYLRVDTPNMLTKCNRSSDTRINYDANDDDGDNNDNESVNQLQVPVPDIPFNRPTNQASEPSSHISHNDSSSNNLSRRPAHQHGLPANGGTLDDHISGADHSQQNHHQQRYQDANRGRNLSMQASQRQRPMLSLKEMNKRLIRILFKTRRQLSDRFLCQKKDHCAPSSDQQQIATTCQEDNLQWDWPDSFIVVYSISDRDSFEYAKHLVSQLRSIKQEIALPILLVANKIDLERAKVVKSEEGRTVARKNACKFLEISCTVGFNMDNLLVGLRTQLILKHHVTLNSIIRQGKILRTSGGLNKPANEKAGNNNRAKGQSDNILVRMYKRYLIDNQELNYDCDNFSKL